MSRGHRSQKVGSTAAYPSRRRRRLLHELVAYDAAGRELDRVDLGYLDTRDFCQLEPTCPSP